MSHTSYGSSRNVRADLADLFAPLHHLLRVQTATNIAISQTVARLTPAWLDYLGSELLVPAGPPGEPGPSPLDKTAEDIQQAWDDLDNMWDKADQAHGQSTVECATQYRERQSNLVQEWKDQGGPSVPMSPELRNAFAAALDDYVRCLNRPKPLVESPE